MMYLSIAAKSKVYHYTEIILTQTQPIVQHILILSQCHQASIGQKFTIDFLTK